MHSSGFQESPSAYLSDDPRTLVGQIRRLGDAGPAYEIIEVSGQGNVTVEVIESSERLVYSIEVVLADPLAVTIP